MDFATLPPEINSARMYSGAGPGPLLAAATAWDQLARDLNTSAAASRSVIAALTTDGWRGPSSLAVANAATRYVTWLHHTAAQAEQTAAQAGAAVAAYEVARAATVPPAEIAANRALWRAMVATNLFGQNSPAIAAAEAGYDAMWAQDAAVMHGYRAASAVARNLTPFAGPPPVANPAGSAAAQTVPATQWAGSPAQVAAPAAFSLTDVFNNAVGTLSGAASTSSSSFGGASIATTNHAISINAERDADQGLGPFFGIGPGPVPAAPVPPGRPPVSALIGRATIAGTLSVPQSWAATVTSTAGISESALPAAAAPSPPTGVQPGMFGEAMLGTLAGRGAGNAAARARRPSVIPRSPAAG